MNRSKIVAILTGAISIILAIAYLILVQLLDLRGEMKPAPISQLDQGSIIVAHSYPTRAYDVSFDPMPNSSPIFCAGGVSKRSC